MLLVVTAGGYIQASRSDSIPWEQGKKDEYVHNLEIEVRQNIPNKTDVNVAREWMQENGYLEDVRCYEEHAFNPPRRCFEKSLWKGHAHGELLMVVMYFKEGKVLWIESYPSQPPWGSPAERDEYIKGLENDISQNFPMGEDISTVSEWVNGKGYNTIAGFGGLWSGDQSFGSYEKILWKNSTGREVHSVQVRFKDRIVNKVEFSASELRIK